MIVKDRKYLDYLREQPCIITGLRSSEYDAVDPAHIGTAGKGLKTDDEALPLLHTRKMFNVYREWKDER